MRNKANIDRDCLFAGSKKGKDVVPRRLEARPGQSSKEGVSSDSEGISLRKITKARM